MLGNLKNWILAQPLWIHAAASVGAFVYFGWVKGKLDSSYVASGHPVDYVTGQTAFNDKTIKSYYAHMQEAGTLDVYWRTQLIDFGFILAMMLMALIFCTLVARIGRQGSWARRAGLLAASAVFLGAVCDIIENGWSFVMLSNPTDFASWLALPYSTFASLKFALIALGMLLVCITILLGLVGRVLRKPRIG